MRGKAGVTAVLLAGILWVLTSPAGALAATINVTTSADNKTDDGLCSLREAVDAANTNAAVNEPGGADCPAGSGGALDTIVLGAFTYDVTGAPGDDTNSSGDLDLNIPASGPVAIEGAGQGSTTIDSDSADRVIDLLDGTLTIRELTITDGDADFGGAIQGRGNPATTHVTLESATVTGNAAGGAGGGGIGIAAGAGQASLTVTDSTIDGNTAVGHGGGARVHGTTSVSGSLIKGNKATNNASDGGGLYLGGPATIADDTTIESNATGDVSTPGGATGGGIYFDPPGAAELQISDSLINNNTATSRGGGVVVAGADATASITDTTIQLNDGFGGGGLASLFGAETTLTRTWVRMNDGVGAGQVDGGGLLNDASTLNVIDSLVENNRAESTFAGADASGGGIANRTGGQLRIEGTTISGNDLVTTPTGTEFGGGIAHSGSSSTVVLNSTLSGNSASGTGSRGGAIVNFNNGGTVEIRHSTFKGNSADSGTAIGLFASTTTIIAGSILDQPVQPCQGGPVTTAGRNVSNETSGDTCQLDPGAGDLENTDPLIGVSPADNGGPHAGVAGLDSPIATFAPATGSPALDHVPPAACVDDDSAPLAVDQRGVTRPGPPSTNCDSGSYEFADSDGDGTEDGVDPWPLDPNDDADGDGVSGHVDNCPNDPNPGQADADGDGAGNACDPWPLDPDDDGDGDGVSGHIDNCPADPNPGQADSDGDGIGDACDSGAPGLKLRATAKKRVKAGKPVKVKAVCPAEDCTVKARAVFKVPRGGQASAAKKLKLKTRRVKKSLAAGEKQRLKLKLKRKDARKLKRLTRRGKVRKRTRVVVKVKAVDADGEKAKEKLKLKLKR